VEKGTAYPSEALPVFSGVRVARSVVFCVVFCRSLFALFVLAIVLSVLRFTASEYQFGYLQRFLKDTKGVTGSQ
jgi:hypothetical protein